LALLACASAVRQWHELEGYTFHEYVKAFGKKYSASEVLSLIAFTLCHTELLQYEVRKRIFESRLEAALKHNADETKSWKQGINHLSDLTEEVHKQ
jgi:cathepsin L